MSEVETQPELSVLVTNKVVESLKTLFITFEISDLLPKYHFKVSPLLTLVIDSFKESPEQKESLFVLKITNCHKYHKLTLAVLLILFHLLFEGVWVVCCILVKQLDIYLH